MAQIKKGLYGWRGAGLVYIDNKHVNTLQGMILQVQWRKTEQGERERECGVRNRVAMSSNDNK